MVDLVVTCGDSFATGTGLEDNECFEKSFGGLVAEYLNVPHHVIARSGCCNYTIWLQVKHAVKQWATNKPFVVISMTNCARTVWYKSGTIPPLEPNIEHLNYQDYPPYTNSRAVPVSTDSIMQSDTLSNLDTYLDGKVNGIWPQLDREPKARLKLLRNWVADFFDPGIKQDYDNGIMLQAHTLLKKHNIPHVFLGWQPELENLMSDLNYVATDWGYWSRIHPDKYGTGHCNEQGHIEVFKLIKPNLDMQLKHD